MRFAANQWDTIGAANKNIAADYNGWINLFGWSTGENPTQASVLSFAYLEPFKNWGENKIANGGNQTWKTLGKDEWNYIFILHANADLLFGLRTASIRRTAAVGTTAILSV